MPRLSNVDRARDIGQLEAGGTPGYCSRQIWCCQATISKLRRRYRDTNDVKDRPRSGRPRVTSVETDHRSEALAARRRYVTATEIQVEVQQPGRQRRQKNQNDYSIPMVYR